MPDFWTRYLLTALAGSLLIYHGLPLLKPAAPPPPAEPPPPPLAVTRRPHIRPENATAVPSTAARPAQGGTGQVSAPPPTVTTVRNYTPSTQIVSSSGEGVTHWGVTVRDAPFFSREGDRRPDLLEGGTLVEQVGSTSSSKGEMALCRVSRPQGWVGPYLIATADLLRFPGDRQEVDAELVDRLRQYHRLNGQIEARRQALERAAVDANPYAAATRRAYEEYQAAQARARELTAQRDRAQGLERNRLMDDLRQMQAQEERLSQAVTEANRKYKEWKARNPVPAGSDPERDPQIRALREQMDALRPSLQGSLGS